MPLYFKFKTRLKPFKNCLKPGYESGGFKDLQANPIF